MRILNILTAVSTPDAQIKLEGSQLLGEIRKHNYNHSMDKYTQILRTLPKVVQQVSCRQVRNSGSHRELLFLLWDF